jgi:hypothetical protein
VAVKSPLNPTTIAPERRGSVQSAQNFISGGAPLGSSIFSAAANKIVGFERGSASVSPRVPDFGSIINTLSSNILNNVQNSLQSINQNITNVVNENLKSLGQNYQNRLKEIDDNTPNKILSNFLSLYQQAIEYIQFLGNRKNINTLGDNIQSLQRIFAETFEVAKIIRQTIVKIVKQLSNLPTASTGGGGLNLDVKVPGGLLRKSAPKGLNRMLKIAGTGAAIAGAGALGSKVVSGMLDIGGGGVQPQMAPGADGLSGPTLDRFNAILEKFSDAIDSLSRKPTSRPSSPGGGGSTVSPVTEKTDPSGSPVVSSGSAGENLAAFTSTLEATGAQNQADVMQVMINRAAKNHSGYGDLFGQLTAKEQFSPISAAINIESADKDAQKIYGPIAAKLGRTPQERINKLREISEGPAGLENLVKLFGKGSATQANAVLSDFKKSGVLSQTAAKDVGGGLYFKGRSLDPSGVYLDRGDSGANKFHGGRGSGPATLAQVSSGTSTATPLTQPSVAAAQTQVTTQQQVAQQVSQPPPSQQKPQVNFLPLNTGDPQPPKSRGQRPASSPSMTSGKSAPFLSSTNHDNFLTLYSKIVYNIVDG